MPKTMREIEQLLTERLKKMQLFSLDRRRQSGKYD